MLLDKVLGWGTNTVNNFFDRSQCFPVSYRSPHPMPGAPFSTARRGEGAGSPGFSAPVAVPRPLLESRPLGKDRSAGPARPQSSVDRGGDLRAAAEPSRGPELPPWYPQMLPGTGASRETPGAAEAAPGPAPRPHGARGSPNPAPLHRLRRGAWELGAEPLKRNTFGDKEAFEVSSVRTPNPLPDLAHSRP